VVLQAGALIGSAFIVLSILIDDKLLKYHPVYEEGGGRSSRGGGEMCARTRNRV
jgi:hypothetical protein